MPTAPAELPLPRACGRLPVLSGAVRGMRGLGWRYGLGRRDGPGCARAGIFLPARAQPRGHRRTFLTWTGVSSCFVP